MKNVLLFFGGVVVGAGMGVGGTMVFLKKKNEEKINEIINKELDEIRQYEYKDGDLVQNKEDANEEEEIIPDLAKMANKVKKDESEKTDYTGYSKSEPKKEVKPIEYVDMDTAYKMESENEYEVLEMDYYKDNLLVYEKDDAEIKITPEDLGLDKTKLMGDDVYAVDHSHQQIYEIMINDVEYDDEEEDSEDNGEESES